MSIELDKLKPEVLDDIAILEEFCEGTEFWLTPHVQAIRAELLRLAEENATLLATNRSCMDWYRQMEHDFRELRKRIEEAPEAEAINIARGIAAVPREWIGKRVRLLIEE